MAINRILVVDDSPTERHLLSEMLKSAGFDPLQAESGEEAIRKAKESKPDLVLMDIVMPGLNGFMATRALAGDEETRHIPVIICTTKGQQTDRLWGLRQGAKDYIVKPVQPKELVEKIKALG
jgi:twitching motility two-component system response regulator PilH